jgi:hypothetical protein
LLKLLERLAKLLLRVHHYWSVPRNWLLQRFSGAQQKPYSIITGSHRYFIASIEEYE